MTAPMVLIHSPLIGPTSWRWVADELTRRGRKVIVPSLLDGAVAGSWERCVDAAATQTRAVGDEVVLVGHSGAGPLLPQIARTFDRPPSRIIFVDAGVPPEHGDTALLPDAFAEHVRSMASDGILPPWSDWFGPDAIGALVPDAERRDAVLADLPRLPVGYFDARVTVPDGWSRPGNGAYILLSEIYRPDAVEAQARGWPVTEMIGGHLDVVTRAADVADAIAALDPG